MAHCGMMPFLPAQKIARFTHIDVPDHVNSLNNGCTANFYSFTVSPMLPSWPFFNSTTGTTYGRPTTATALATYTIKGTNDNDNGATLTLGITVDPLHFHGR